MATCAYAMPTTTARVNLVSNARARGVRARLGIVTGARIPSARHPAGVPGRRLGTLVVARSRDDGGSGGGSWGKFLTGFLVGGAVFGVAGVLFAPQISKTFLKGKGEVGKFLYDDWTEDEEEDSLEKTRQNLNDKIAQLNAAIDNFSTEADRGLSDKITKLNSDMEVMEKDLSGKEERKEEPKPAESR